MIIYKLHQLLQWAKKYLNIEANTLNKYLGVLKILFYAANIQVNFSPSFLWKLKIELRVTKLCMLIMNECLFDHK